ncbi:MAG TPA: dethiobiotin synthase [Verrucomicrobiae bacterium]|jgi:dethiobiotin synthetase
MKQTLFITGTDTGVGKTVLTALLVKFLRGRGVNAAALKPICSGNRDDARTLHAAMDGILSPDEINPWHFRAPVAPLLAARRENKRLKLSQVLAHVRAMQKRFDVLLVEGAGGLLSPLGVCSGGLRPSQSSALTERRYKRSFDSRDLILETHATPIVVAQNKLGAVNQILLTLEALPEKFRAEAKVVLVSPPKPDSATNSNTKLLERSLDPAKVFSLPWFGEKFDTAEALKNSRAQRMLRALAQT